MRVTVGAGFRTTTMAIIVAATMAAVGACSVDSLETAGSPSSIVNSCENDADCSSDLMSGTCGPGMCVASSGDIKAAFVEVVPPAVAYYGAGDSFLIPLEDLEHGNWNHELKLPAYAKIQGKLTTDASLLGQPPSESCEQAYDSNSQSLRVHVELSRSDATHGLPSLSVAANAELGNEGWTFFEEVPAGRYDVYAKALSGCDGDFPPIFAPRQMLDPGVVDLELYVGALSTLSGIVTPPTDPENEAEHVSLAGWEVSLVEPEGGRLISTTRNLNDSNPTNFKLRFQPLAGVTPLLRLSPPESLVAPEVFWDLSVLDLDGNGQVAPDIRGLDLSTVRVSARIIDKDVTPVGGASLRLRSIKLLNAASGLSARYDTVVTAGDDGGIDLNILPGTYQVIVSPPDRTELALTQTTWEIAPTPTEQAGRTVEVPPRPQLRGSVVEPVDGKPLRGVTVSVLPSTSGTQDYLDRILGPTIVMPRVASGFTDDLGNFDIAVDPGLVNLFVKPSEASSFPWLIQTAVDVPGPALTAMPVTFPVPLAGVLRDPGDNPVQRALLRVFAVLDDDTASGLARSNDPVSSDGAIQVAEGRTDETGHFVLLLPWKLINE